MIKKILFRTLAKINRKLLPRYSKRDLNRLSAFDKILVGYRYWVTKNALD
jgi:hypothetical protein